MPSAARLLLGAAVAVVAVHYIAKDVDWAKRQPATPAASAVITPPPPRDDAADEARRAAKAKADAEDASRRAEADRLERERHPTWQDLSLRNKPGDDKLMVEVGRMEWWDVCAAWGREQRSPKVTRRSQVLEAWLVHQELLNAADRSHVMDRSVDIGMTECGVFAARGRPDAVNNTKNVYGSRSQIVYRSPSMYVYTEDAPRSRVKIVTAIQN